jgi:glycosyltransferase involved in cell wall biosynthesis
MGDSLREKIKIGIIGGYLAPPFNEAVANQMYILSKELNTPIITFGDLRYVPFKKIEQYFIINMGFFMKKIPVLSFINCVFLYMTVKLCERKFDLLYLHSTTEGKFLNYLNLKKCVPIMTSIPFIEDKNVEKFVKKIAPELPAIITQSNKVKNQLIDLGIDSNKIHVVYPLIDLNKFKNTEAPDLNKFKILFSSAPLTEDTFEKKGVSLLLESFKDFVVHTDAILYLVWRKVGIGKLNDKISELKLEDHVEIIDDIVFMPEMYAKSHITVIPYLNLKSSPEIPLSAVESLACGRPIVTTDIAEIAEIVKKYKCGCVSKPIKNDFLVALEEGKRNYQIYQRNCRETAEELFSLNIGKFDEIHRNLLGKS